MAGGAAGAVAGRSHPGAATEAIPTSSAAGPTGRARPVDDEEYEQTDEIPVREGRHNGGYWMLGALGLLALAAVAFVVFQVLSPSEDAEVAQVLVPSVLNTTQDVAEQRIEEAGLVPEVEQRQSTEAEGEVIEQNPNSNSSVDEGSTVEIVVSSGPDAIVIFDVQGFQEDAARTRIEADGLTVAGRTEEQNDADFARGEVVATDPAIGQSVSRDTEVTLILASGRVDVPNVVGQEQSDAVLELRDLNLSPATTFAESNESSPGTVLEQSIEAGEEVDYGERITLTIATSPVPTVTTTQTQTVTATTPPEENTPDEPTETEEPTTDPPTTTDPPDQTDSTAGGGG
ncbi:MAG: PASTA domain-containing protein, partial [Ornithinimicrobium sp.]